MSADPRVTKSEARWRETVQAAGLRPERTPAEWVAHPTALDDLARVLAGTASLSQLCEERREEKRRRAA